METTLGVETHKVVGTRCRGKPRVQTRKNTQFPQIVLEFAVYTPGSSKVRGIKKYPYSSIKRKSLWKAVSGSEIHD